MLKLKTHSFAKEFLPEIVSIRRHLHAHPELSFEETETAKYIALKLKEYGISFKEGIVGTGIIGIIEGKNPTKKIIALRADMDALPITEQNNVSYKSINKGVMHACGHDVHTAMLLGAAKILASLKSEFEGSVKLIFQPGEEKLPGGASLMIKEGVLENPKPNAILAAHVFPSMEAGKVGFKKGMYMASTDEIYVTVKGKGGHAAMPKTYVNPIIIASRIITALNEEFMVNKKQNEIPTVLAFGKFVANGATNVIPDEVYIEGTFRTMNEKWRKEAHLLIKQRAEIIAKEMGGICDFNILDGYPVLINDTQLTSNAEKYAQEYLGAENVEELEMRMTAEDFAFYSHHLPACFYRVGTGNVAKGITSNVHTSTFDIDEKALEVGAGLMAWITINELNAI